jgi:hypothetical protein
VAILALVVVVTVKVILRGRALISIHSDGKIKLTNPFKIDKTGARGFSGTWWAASLHQITFYIFSAALLYPHHPQLPKHQIPHVTRPSPSDSKT